MEEEKLKEIRKEEGLRKRRMCVERRGKARREVEEDVEEEKKI